MHMCMFVFCAFALVRVCVLKKNDSKSVRLSCYFATPSVNKHAVYFLHYMIMLASAKCNRRRKYREMLFTAGEQTSACIYDLNIEGL